VTRAGAGTRKAKIPREETEKEDEELSRNAIKGASG